jgi:YbbR domain-containing protein
MSAKEGLREAIRSALVENLGLKAISFLCALALYSFIHGAENAQRTVAVSVVSIMPPDAANRQLMTQLPTEVNVTLRGSRTQLDALRSDDLGSLQLDLREGRKTRIDLTAEMFSLPANLKVEQINPATMELRWDDVVSRQIPVQIARTGEPAPGFSVRGTTAVDPSQVNARGPRTVIDTLQFVRAAPFDITGLSEGTYRRALPLDLPPKFVRYDVDTVNATVEVARALVTKEFSGLKVQVVGAGGHVSAEPSKVTVVITGTAEDTNVLAESIIPIVDLKAANADLSKPGSVQLPVSVDVPRAKVEIRPPSVLLKWP